MSLTLIRDTPDYKFEIDDVLQSEHGHMLLVHADIRRWSPRTLKQALREWSLFRTIVTQPLFALGPPCENDKWRRFVERFGFRFNSTVRCNNGATRSLYISTVNTS